MRRRDFIAGTTASLAFAGCSSPVVRRVPPKAITPDPRGGVVVIVDTGPSRSSEAYLGAVAFRPGPSGPTAGPAELLGACVPGTHVVTLFPPGRSLLVAYDDSSYDALEAEIVPGAIYTVVLEHDDGDILLRPLAPGRESVRRLLDETDPVELARPPRRDDLATFERKVRLARIRYADYPVAKRASRTLGPAHMWR